MIETLPSFKDTYGLPAGNADQTANLQAFVNNGGGVLPKADYHVRGYITVPANTILAAMPGVRIIFDGTLPQPGNRQFIFLVQGSNCTFTTVVDKTELVARTETPSQWLWLIGIGGGIDNTRIVNVRCENMCRTFTNTETNAYPSATAANSPSNVVIDGGGVRYDVLFTNADGSLVAQSDAVDLLCYVRNYSITNCTYKNCSSFIQIWGGNADPGTDGAVSNERKAKNGYIANCDGDTCIGAGIWTSMADTLVVTGCRLNHVGDVGFDAEGSVNVDFIDNHVADSFNANLSIFSYNRNVRFVGNRSLQTTPGRNHFLIANGGSYDNRDVELSDNLFESVNTYGGFNVGYGNADLVTVKNNKFFNVVIFLGANNSWHTLCLGNQQHFDVAVPISYNHGCLLIGGRNNQLSGQYGKFILKNHHVRSIVAQPSGTRAVYIEQIDYNASPATEIVDCTVDGVTTDIELVWAGGNRGYSGRFLIKDNTLAGGVVKHDGTTTLDGAGVAAAPGQFVVTGNRGYDYALIPGNNAS
jgi:hypothetical protein